MLHLISKKRAQGTFTSKANQDQRNETGAKKRNFSGAASREQSSATNDALEVEGYELIPDTVETNGGIWEHAYQVRGIVTSMLIH